MAWVPLLAVGVGLWAPMGAGAPTNRRKSTHVGTDQASEAADGPSPIDLVASTSALATSPTSVEAEVGMALSPPPISIDASSGSSSSTTFLFRAFGIRSIPNILLRKYYHFLIFLMFAPAIIWEPGFVALSSAVALSLFILAEYIRWAKLPPFAQKMSVFMKSYLDLRDSGSVILTHSYLLLGCALPLWLHMHVLAVTHPSAIQAALDSYTSFHSILDEWRRTMSIASTDGDASIGSVPQELIFDMDHYLPALAGVLILGVGDSMASIVGVCVGRIRWFDSKRTLEGTLAAIITILLTVFALFIGMQWINIAFYDGLLHILAPNWSGVLVATTLACMLEAATSQIDNLFLPLFYYAALVLLVD